MIRLLLSAGLLFCLAQNAFAAVPVLDFSDITSGPGQGLVMVRVAALL